MDEIITTPCYIVLEIPSPMAEKIRAMRAKFDAPRATMAAEITLSGSSGLGHIVYGQKISDVTAEIDKIASHFASFETSFDSVERFPGTEIYFMTLANQQPFINLNNALKNTAIAFDVNHYPYRPHCTLKLRSTPSDPELMELLFMDVPKESFTLDTIALYSLPDANSCELLHMTELTGKIKP